MQQLDQYDERFVEGGFDAVAARYGEVPFLRGAAALLVEAVVQRPLTRALDIATGPGTSALLLASKAPGCDVVGIDVAPGMVAQAMQRSEQIGLSNAHFQVASALSLPFDSESFDAVFCSSAIYYMADFDAAVREWQRTLRPGGVLAFSTFGAGVLEPMASLFDARVRAHGIVVPQPTPLYRLNQVDACQQLLERAGLIEVATREQQVGYWVRDEEIWWRTLMSTGFQALVAALNPGERQEFERAHKSEVREHVTERGLWINAPVVVACGRRPQ